MLNKKRLIILILRDLWLLLAAMVIIYIISQNVIMQRTITYSPDWQQSITPNVTGWYPEIRANYASGAMRVLAEPLYLQLYLPDDFQWLKVNGEVADTGELLRLGLRQKDGSWQWQEISEPNFTFDYYLANAQVKGSKLEMILSVPYLQASSSVALSNNWKFILSH